MTSKKSSSASSDRIFAVKNLDNGLYYVRANHWTRFGTSERVFNSERDAERAAIRAINAGRNAMVEDITDIRPAITLLPVLS